jgi:hypothetical protein
VPLGFLLASSWTTKFWEQAVVKQVDLRDLVVVEEVKSLSYAWYLNFLGC